MTTSSNGSIFCVIGPLWGESTGHPQQRPMTWSFGVLFHVCLKKCVRKQSRYRWFETPWRSLWCYCNEMRRTSKDWCRYHSASSLAYSTLSAIGWCYHSQTLPSKWLRHHVMSSCVRALSHYMNQCWLFFKDGLWHSPEGNFIGNAQDIYPWHEFENKWFKITSTFPRGLMS